jgi:hypothetical protein
MKIDSIQIKEHLWNVEEQKYVITYKTIDRDEYAGDFDLLILENLKSSAVRWYAEVDLGMVEENYRRPVNPSELDISVLKNELKNRGFETIKCQTLTDSFKLEQVKELMQIQ